MGKLDKSDYAILYQLDLDARQTNSQIAKKVRLSKEVVGYRISRLIKDGIIQGFYSVIDTTKLGYLNVRIFLRFKNSNPIEEKEILDFFSKKPNSWWVNSISGSNLDLGVAFWVKDIAEFSQIKNEFLGKYRERIENYRDSIYSAIYIWNRAYLKQDAQKKQLSIPPQSKIVTQNEKDLRILATMADDARISIVDIASKVGLSVTAVQHRLKKLRKNGVIIGYRAKLNLSKIEHYWYKVEFQLEDYSKKKQLLGYFAAHPNIVYAYESIGGGADLEMELEVKSPEEFKKIMDGIKTKFKDAIRNYNHYLWTEEYKILFFPSG